MKIALGKEICPHNLAAVRFAKKGKRKGKPDTQSFRSG